MPKMYTHFERRRHTVEGKKRTDFEFDNSVIYFNQHNDTFKLVNIDA